MNADKFKEILMKHIDIQIDGGSILDPTRIATEVCSRYKGELSERGDGGLYEYATYRTVRDAIGKLISKKLDTQPGEVDRQFLLPGFKHLQTHYIVKRDGASLGVPVAEMTDEEIDEKVNLYQKRSHALQEHVTELLEFKKTRNHKP